MAGDERVEYTPTTLREKIERLSYPMQAGNDYPVQAVALSDILSVLGAHDAEVIAGQRGGVDVEAAARRAHDTLAWSGPVAGHGRPWEWLTEEERDGWREFVSEIAALMPSDGAPMPYIAPGDGAGEKSGIPQRPSVSGEQVDAASREGDVAARNAFHAGLDSAQAQRVGVEAFLRHLGIEVRDA